jgi:antitoxin YefM
MEAISYSKLRANLAKSMDRVCENREPMVITRQGGESVVLLSLEDFEALDETAFLMRSPKNAQRLSESIREIEAGHYKERELVD